MSDTKGTSSTAQNSVTAIDIVLEVDATMMQHAQAANAALRKNYPKGYSLDAEHKPHISVMGGYFYTASLDRTYAAVGKVLATEKVLSWKMKAFKYYYIPLKEIGLGGIVVEPTPDMVEAATETDRCTGTVHVTHRYRRRLREDAESARDQPGHPRCASDLSFRSCRRALQPACHHRSRHGQISGHAT